MKRAIGLGVLMWQAAGQVGWAQVTPVNLALQTGAVFQESGPSGNATFSVGPVPTPDKAATATWTLNPVKGGTLVQNPGTGAFLAVGPNGNLVLTGAQIPGPQGSDGRLWRQNKPSAKGSQFRLFNIGSGRYLGRDGTLLPKEAVQSTVPPLAALWSTNAPFDSNSEAYVRLESTATPGQFLTDQNNVLNVGFLSQDSTGAHWVMTDRGNGAVSLKNVANQLYLNGGSNGVVIGPLSVNPTGGGASLWNKMASTSGTIVAGFTFVSVDTNKPLSTKVGGGSPTLGTTSPATVFQIESPTAAATTPAAGDTTQFSRLHSVTGPYAQTGLHCGPMPANTQGADWHIVRFQAGSAAVVVIVNRVSNRSLSVQNGRVVAGPPTALPDGTGPNVWVVETVGAGPAFKLRNQSSGQYLAIGAKRPGGTFSYGLGPGSRQLSQWTLEPSP